MTRFFYFVPFTLFVQSNTTGVVLKEETIIKAALLSDINGKDAYVGETINQRM
jgi:hypothetical protein